MGADPSVLNLNLRPTAQEIVSTSAATCSVAAQRGCWLTRKRPWDAHDDRPIGHASGTGVGADRGDGWLSMIFHAVRLTVSGGFLRCALHPVTVSRPPCRII